MDMDISKIKVKSKIFPPSSKMKKYGIKGKANIRLYIGDLCLVELRNCLFKTRKNDGGIFTAPPQETWEDSNGDTQYYPLWMLAPDEDFGTKGGLRERIETSVLNALKRAMNGGSEEKPKPKPKSESNGWGNDDDDDEDEDEEKPKKKKKNKDFESDDDDEDDWM